MKTSFCYLFLLASSVSAFAPPSPTKAAVATRQFMFSGSGTGAEDDEEQMQAIEQGAAALGMSVDEYKLGLQARERMQKEMNDCRVTAGSDGVTVERDANSPSTFLEVTITEEGKAKGREKVEKEIVAACAITNEDAKIGRENAQRNMMKYIQETMKA
mmetsp:Transcript_24048/g.33607  ORF Transcript_24048/g.33607 Transcript_24048/m.33607 type:complete len:158 (+) Transcript_24048:75-548(+)